MIKYSIFLKYCLDFYTRQLLQLFISNEKIDIINKIKYK